MVAVEELGRRALRELLVGERRHVVPETLAVVGDDGDDGVLEQAPRAQALEEALQLGVHLTDLLVVAPALGREVAERAPPVRVVLRGERPPRLELPCVPVLRGQRPGSRGR